MGSPQKAPDTEATPLHSQFRDTMKKARKFAFCKLDYRSFGRACDRLEGQVSRKGHRAVFIILDLKG